MPLRFSLFLRPRLYARSRACPTEFAPFQPPFSGGDACLSVLASFVCKPLAFTIWTVSFAAGIQYTRGSVVRPQHKKILNWVNGFTDKAGSCADRKRTELHGKGLRGPKGSYYPHGSVREPRRNSPG